MRICGSFDGVVTLRYWALGIYLHLGMMMQRLLGIWFVHNSLIDAHLIQPRKADGKIERDREGEG
jgi:hypothetical protein